MPTGAAQFRAAASGGQIISLETLRERYRDDFDPKKKLDARPYQLYATPGVNSVALQDVNEANSAGVPINGGNVPKCIGITSRHPNNRQAIAAPRGDMVNKSPIGKNASEGACNSCKYDISAKTSVSPAK